MAERDPTLCAVPSVSRAPSSVCLRSLSLLGSTLLPAPVWLGGQTPQLCARGVTVFSFDPAPFQAFSQPAIEMSGSRQGKVIVAQLTGGFPLNS